MNPLIHVEPLSFSDDLSLGLTHLYIELSNSIELINMYKMIINNKTIVVAPAAALILIIITPNTITKGRLKLTSHLTVYL